METFILTFKARDNWKMRSSVALQEDLAFSRLNTDVLVQFFASDGGASLLSGITGEYVALQRNLGNRALVNAHLSLPNASTCSVLLPLRDSSVRERGGSYFPMRVGTVFPFLYVLEHCLYPEVEANAPPLECGLACDSLLVSRGDIHNLASKVMQLLSP